MHDASDIAQRLARMIHQLAREVLPNGRKDGNEWRVGSVAGEAGSSLAVRLSGFKAGVWSDFTTGEAGDALDLVAAVRFAGDRRAALDWSRAWLGLPPRRRDDDGTPAPPAPATPAAPAPSGEDAAAAEAAAQRDRERLQRAALAIFLAARQDLHATAVDCYLQGRGIALERLGFAPRALRYHASLFNRESGGHLPAMVAAVTNAEGVHVATHRTWLAPDGAGGWRKAKLRTAKMSLGPIGGGAIRLARGASRKPLRDAPDGETVVIAEGIETALSVALACRDLRVICSVSLGNMSALALPPAVRTVILAADNDGDNIAAARGLQKAAEHFAREGRVVRIARPPGDFKDFNDLLRGIAKTQP